MHERLKIISLKINSISFDESIQRVLQWGMTYTPSFVCFANVHMVIEAYWENLFLDKLNKATLILADGKPVATACKWLYGKKQERIAGMDFMLRILEESNNKSIKIFLYGSTEEVLNELQRKIKTTYPFVKIVGALSPPFRALSKEEEQKYIDDINTSEANIVMVSLGCPKQEKWMAENYQLINAVLLGIGGAFAVTAVLQKRSPFWMQKAGLEWLYRLGLEPKRLFKRYFVTNSLFIFLLIKTIITHSFSKKNKSQ